MRALARAAGTTAAVFSWLCSEVEAATVDAGTLTAITVEAPLFDPNVSDAYGCDPAGCVGDLTRDGDLTSLSSRWACKPALGAAGSTCSVTYSLADSLTLEGLNVAMYKGDSRTRTMEIHVDGDFFTSWTSSGTTSTFENVDLGINGQTVELRGVLEDSEWVSIMEVEILTDDGAGSGAVEAGTLCTVTTVAALYDTNLSTENGCDPAGCTASLTRDGDFARTSRWSCTPKLGGTCTISYDLGAVRAISELRLAMYKGTTRTTTMEVYIDGALVTTWTSSGTTEALQSIDLSGSSGKFVEVTGVLADSEWLSIIEAEIMVLSDGIAPPTLPPDNRKTVGLLPLASGAEWDTERFYSKDGDFSTSWSCTGDPRDPNQRYIYYECSLSFSMVSYRHIKQVKIALPDGANGPVEMRIATSMRNELTERFVTSSGTTDVFEAYDFDHFTNFVVISGVFTSAEQSISISEVAFMEEEQPGVVRVASFTTPRNIGEALEEALGLTSDSVDVLDQTVSYTLNSYATVTAIEIEFPVGDTYKFDLKLYTGDSNSPFTTITDWESSDIEGWQSFDLGKHLNADQFLTKIALVIKGTVSGAPGFKMLDSRIMGAAVNNPTDTFYVASAFIEEWSGSRYPDFVGAGTGDQKAIMGAICAVKKSFFNGVNCAGGDPTATGTVHLSMGAYYVDGNIFMKSGVFLSGQYSIDDSPHTTDINLEEGAAGKTGTGSIIVMDRVSDAKIEEVWIEGLYDPETSNTSPAVEGLGTTCLSISDSKNISLVDMWIENCDGDAVVLRNSGVINIDAGGYDDEYLPNKIGSSRGTGLVVDTCTDIWVRRHNMYDNGVAGIHISGSNNFTFEATIGSSNSEGEGNVGSLDGQQPIEIIIESSKLVTFQDMKVTSSNEPVMTISADSSAMSFNNCGFSSVLSGTCVIQTEDPSEVNAKDDELNLEGTCYTKV